MSALKDEMHDVHQVFGADETPGNVEPEQTPDNEDLKIPNFDNINNISSNDAHSEVEINALREEVQIQNQIEDEIENVN